MRFLRNLLLLALILSGGNAFGQYYMFDADEDGVAFEFARAEESDITADGVGLTVKSSERSGVYIAYAKATAPNGQEAKNYGIGYEHYVTSNRDVEFLPAAIASIGIANSDLPYDRSVTNLTAGIGLGFLGSIKNVGRNVSAAGLSIAMPLTSSEGLDPDVLISVLFSSTQGIRVSQNLILTGGLGYSVNLNEGVENSFEFKVGLAFATAKK